MFHEKQMIFQFISFFKLFLLDFLWFMLLLSWFFAVPHSSLWFMFRSAAAAAAVETAVIVFLFDMSFPFFVVIAAVG